VTAEEIRAVCQDRLAGRWTEKLVAEHATPVVLVGVGHDARKGTLVICAVEEPSVTNRVIAGFLRDAAIQLDPAHVGAMPIGRAAPTDGRWAMATLDLVLKHLAEAKHACGDCRAFVQGHGLR